MSDFQSMKDVNPLHTSPTFLLVGESGAGKTTQALTLPRPCGVIAFAAKTKAALAGADGVNVAEFLVDKYELGMVGPGARTEKLKAAAETWVRWKDFAYKMREKWGEYRSIVVDDITSYQSMAMAHVLEERGHVGEGPQTGARNSNDYDPPIRATLQLVGEFTSIAASRSIPVVLIAHRKNIREVKGDSQGSVLEYTIDAYGRTREFLPRLVTHTFYCFSEAQGGGRRFIGVTQPGRYQGVKIDNANTSLRLPSKIDLTIGDWAKPQGYGIGALLEGKHTEAK